MPPRQISFKAAIYPHLKGQITLHLLWSQTWETFNRSQSCHCSNCNKSSSSVRRHTLYSLSSHGSSSCHPSANRLPHHHSCHDTNKHIHTPFHTHHFSHRHHSCCSTDWSQSHSCNSHCTAQETEQRKAKQCPRPSTPYRPHHSKTVNIQDFPSDSSSDSDSNSDPLFY